MFIEYKIILEGLLSLKILFEVNEIILDMLNLKMCIGVIEVVVELIFRGCILELLVVVEVLDLKEEFKCWSIISGLKL